MAQQAIPTDAPIRFEAVIVPHRSLTPRGLRVLITVICLLCGMTVLRFWFLGAWPVIGFGVIEVGLAVFLLWLNARRARASEIVLLSDEALRIVRTGLGRQRQDITLPVAWLNVVLEEPPGRVPKLLVTTRGMREEIATTLGEPEKRDLCAALRAALHELRNPRFENPQLRDTSDTGQ